MPDSTNTDLETQLRALGSADDAGDPATEWRPGQERATETAAATPTEEAAAAAEQADAAARHLAFEQEWQQYAEQERVGTPELLDANSELSKAVQDLLQEMPALNLTPRGYQHAAAMARARIQATEMPALRARLATLTKENERLARLTSIPGSPPARSSRDSAESGLSERELRRLAYDFDSVSSI